MVDFDSMTDAEAALAALCVKRAAKMAKAQGAKGFDSLGRQMDLHACHCNGQPLDFDRLLAFPDSAFAHDINGIADHLDRATGKLTDCFLPKCAKASQ